MLAEQDGRGWSAATALSDPQLEALADLDRDDASRDRTSCPGSAPTGSRVNGLDGGTLVAGLPVAEVEETSTT